MKLHEFLLRTSTALQAEADALEGYGVRVLRLRAKLLDVAASVAMASGLAALEARESVTQEKQGCSIALDRVAIEKGIKEARKRSIRVR